MSHEDTRRDERPSKRPAGSWQAGEPARSGVSRRGFLQAMGLGATAAAIPEEGLLGRALPPEESGGDGKARGPGAVSVDLRVDGKDVRVKVEPRVTLLDALRDHLGVESSEPVDITGPKRVCDRASCGACTILMDGKTVYACTILAIRAQGADIRTVEGLATEGKLHPVQEEFIHADGLMCGFCTPGFVVSAAAFLESGEEPSRDAIRKALDGNICRCGTQPRALEAVERAARRMKKGR